MLKSLKSSAQKILPIFKDPFLCDGKGSTLIHASHQDIFVSGIRAPTVCLRFILIPFPGFYGTFTQQSPVTHLSYSVKNFKWIRSANSRFSAAYLSQFNSKFEQDWRSVAPRKLQVACRLYKKNTCRRFFSLRQGRVYPPVSSTLSQ